MGLKVGLEMAKELLTAHRARVITKAGAYKDGGGLRLNGAGDEALGIVDLDQWQEARAGSWHISRRQSAGRA